MKVQSKVWQGRQKYRSTDVEVILPEKEENILHVQSFVRGKTQKEMMESFSENVIKIIYFPDVDAEDVWVPLHVYNYAKNLHCIYEPIAFERDIRPFSTYWKRNLISDDFFIYYELRSAFKLKKGSEFDSRSKLLDIKAQEITKEMLMRRISSFKNVGIVQKDMRRMLFRHPEQEVEIRLDGSKIGFQEIDRITYAWMLGQKIFYDVEPKNVLVKITTSYEKKEALVEITDEWQEIVRNMQKNQIPFDWLELLKKELQEE